MSTNKPAFILAIVILMVFSPAQAGAQKTQSHDDPCPMATASRAQAQLKDDSVGVDTLCVAESLGFVSDVYKTTELWHKALLNHMEKLALKPDENDRRIPSRQEVEQVLIQSVETDNAHPIRKFAAWAKTREGAGLVAAIDQGLAVDRPEPMAGQPELTEERAGVYRELFQRPGAREHLATLSYTGNTAPGYLGDLVNLSMTTTFHDYKLMLNNIRDARYRKPVTTRAVDSWVDEQTDNAITYLHQKYAQESIEDLRQLSKDAADAGAKAWGALWADVTEKYIEQMIDTSARRFRQLLQTARKSGRTDLQRNPWDFEMERARTAVRAFPWYSDSEILKQAREGAAGSIEERIAEAKDLLGANTSKADQPRLAQLVDSVLTENPENVEALILLSRIESYAARDEQGTYFEKSLREQFRPLEFALAFAALDRALEIEPNNGDALVYMGFAQFTLGNLDAAQALYEKARVIGTDNIWFRSNLARLAFEQGNVQSALDQHWAVIIDPRTSDWVRYWAVFNSRRIFLIQDDLKGMLAFTARHEFDGIFFESDLRTRNANDILQRTDDFQSALSELDKVPPGKRNAYFNQTYAKVLVTRAALDPGADQDALLRQAATLFGDDLSNLHKRLAFNHDPHGPMLLLEKKGYTLNRPFREQHPLCTLIRKDQYRTLADLLALGVNPNLSDGLIGPLLFCAVYDGSAESVRMLVKAGANPAVRYRGMTAERIASYRVRDDKKVFLKKVMAPALAASRDSVLNQALNEPDLQKSQMEVADIFRSWAQADLKAAAAAFMKLDAPEEYSQAGFEITKVWVKVDPDAALAFAEKAGGKERSLWILTVDLVMQVNPELALQAINSLDNQQQRVRMLVRVVRSAAKKNPQTAAEIALAIPEGPIQKDAIDALLLAWIQTSPEDAWKWLMKLPKATQQLAFERFTPSLAQSTRGLEFMRNLPLEEVPEADRRNWGGYLVMYWGQHDPGAAADWALEHSQYPQSSLWLDNAARAIAGVDVQKALDIAEGIEVQSDYENAIRGVISSWSTSDLAAALKWVEAHPNLGNRVTLYGILAQNWCSFDIKACTEWMVALPEGPERDNAIHQLFFKLPLEKEVLKDYFTLVTSDGAKMRLGYALAQRAVRKRGPEFARDLIGELHLAPDQYDKIVQSIENGRIK